MCLMIHYRAEIVVRLLFQMPHKKRGKKNHIQVKKILANSELSILEKKKGRKSFERVPRYDNNPADRKREERILNDDSDDDTRKQRSQLKKHINKELQEPTKCLIPKKSRKNKYLLLSHPELKDVIPPLVPKSKKRPRETADVEEPEPAKKKPVPEPEPKAKPSICDKLVSNMITSRFRYLNEKLYTSSSTDAQNMFKKDPRSFYAYHQGYAVSVIKLTFSSRCTCFLSSDEHVALARSTAGRNHRLH